jgi:transposase-like protein
LLWPQPGWLLNEPRKLTVRPDQKPGDRHGELCRSIGVSEQTYYRWRAEYGGLKLDQAKRL